MNFLALSAKSEVYPDLINLEKVLYIKVRTFNDEGVTVDIKFENNERITLRDMPKSSYERILNALRRD
ncbi:hypothetical protein [Aggregatibacter kilianii]|uniref:hypothetical protein n=1 Tax=Aggregatibacter kilianii TaxID=2025884 RepID=UPI000D655B01|nr:hypothetical protein [Aggregatibacter kilianii]